MGRGAPEGCELHVGTFFAVDQARHGRRGTRGGQYLDVLDRLVHLRDLGVNATEFLPIHEFVSPVSRGYSGVDLFSPDMDDAGTDPAGCLGNRLLRLDYQFHRTLLEFSWILSHRCLTHRTHLLRCVIALVSVYPEEYSLFMKPDALKGARQVLNGGDEETGLYRPHLVATQLGYIVTGSDFREG
jgi:hypothetical protein